MAALIIPAVTRIRSFGAGVVVLLALLIAVPASAATARPHISAPLRVVATGDFTVKGSGLYVAVHHKKKVPTYVSRVLRATFTRDGSVGVRKAVEPTALARDPDAHGLVPLGIAIEAPSTPGRYYLTVTTRAGTSNRVVVLVVPLRHRGGLRAHIDPSFVQNPENYLDVTYSYDATTIVTGTGGAQGTSLPDGVLDFYSDGSLACSTNVGGAATSATCEIVYAQYENATVVVEYLSGTASATQTSTAGIWWAGPTSFTFSAFDYWANGGCDDGVNCGTAFYVAVPGSTMSYPAPPAQDLGPFGTLTMSVNGGATLGCGGSTPEFYWDQGSPPPGIAFLAGCTMQTLYSLHAQLSFTFSGTTYTTPDLPPGQNTITLNPASGTGTTTPWPGGGS